MICTMLVCFSLNLKSLGAQTNTDLYLYRVFWRKQDSFEANPEKQKNFTSKQT